MSCLQLFLEVHAHVLSLNECKFSLMKLSQVETLNTPRLWAVERTPHHRRTCMSSGIASFDLLSKSGCQLKSDYSCKRSIYVIKP